MESGLRISRIRVRNFGKIRDFDGILSDMVFIDNSYEGSDKISDLILVIKIFLNMGLNVERGDDLTKSLIVEFRDKIREHTYIEVCFNYDAHDFLYRAVVDENEIVREVVMDIGSKFTIQGKLLFEFMSYIMNPYYMRLAHIDQTAIKYFDIDHGTIDSAVDVIWYALRHYNPIDNVNDILDFCHSDYDEIVERAKSKYGSDITLVDKFSVHLTDDGLKGYINGEEVQNLAKCDNRYQMAYSFMSRIIANYLVGQILGIESENIVYPPIVLDANLEDNQYLDFGELLSIVKNNVFTMPRQIFMVEGQYINRLLDEDIDLSHTTRIYDSDLGIKCITQSVS